MSTGAAHIGRDPGQPLGPRLLRLYAGVLTERRTYLALLYLALAFPIGLGGFVALAIAFPTGLGMTITIVGLPMLVATMYGWCFLAGLHAGLANALLGTRIPELFEPAAGKPWHLSVIRTRLQTFMTWRAFAFILASLPMGIAAFTLLSILFMHVGLLLLAPLFAELPSATVFWRFDGVVAEPSATTSDGLHALGLHFTAWYEALPIMILGILLLPAAGHAVRFGGFLSAKAATFILGGGSGSPQDTLGLRQVESALAWEGVLFGRALEKHAPRTIGLHAAALGIHFLTSLAVLVILLAINALASPGNWWVIWVAWAAAIPFVTHAGFFARGVTGAHLGLFFIVNLGLFVIDAALYPEGTWFFWPLLGSSLLLMIHLVTAYFYQRQHRGQPAKEVSPWRVALAAALVPGDRQPVESKPSPAGEAAILDFPSVPAVQAMELHDAATSSDLDRSLSASTAEPETPSAPAVGVDLDGDLRRVTVDGEEVDLTPKEFELLSMLLASPGRPFSREHILDRIWSNEYEVTDRTIDTHVLRLRKKLGQHGSSIQTVWGIGYKWTPENGGTKAEDPKPKKSGW